MSNAGKILKPHALLLQPKRNNFTSDNLHGATGLSLRLRYGSRSSPTSHTCVCNGHPGSKLFCGRCILDDHFSISFYGTVEIQSLDDVLNIVKDNLGVLKRILVTCLKLQSVLSKEYNALKYLSLAALFIFSQVVDSDLTS